LHTHLRSRDIEAIGLLQEYLVRPHRQGKLNRPGRGIYTLPEANVTESLLCRDGEACARSCHLPAFGTYLS